MLNSKMENHFFCDIVKLHIVTLVNKIQPATIIQQRPLPWILQGSLMH